jgi:NADH:ubiquinone oxidoreductase subunit 6 (subunit J)
MTDIGLILTYILIFIAAIACCISPLLKMKNNPGEMKKMIMPLMGLILILGLSILIASSEVLPNHTNSQGVLISNTTSKVIGGCLITFYILSIIACGSILYSEFVYKFFKNGKK